MLSKTVSKNLGAIISVIDDMWLIGLVVNDTHLVKKHLPWLCDVYLDHDIAQQYIIQT